MRQFGIFVAFTLAAVLFTQTACCRSKNGPENGERPREGSHTITLRSGGKLLFSYIGPHYQLFLNNKEILTTTADSVYSQENFDIPDLEAEVHLLCEWDNNALCQAAYRFITFYRNGDIDISKAFGACGALKAVRQQGNAVEAVILYEDDDQSVYSWEGSVLKKIGEVLAYNLD